MPEKKGYGYSENTIRKQEDLRYLFNMFIPIYRAVIPKWPKFDQTFHYIDINAGPGVSLDSLVVGSPLIFLDAVQKHGIAYHATLIEKELIHYQSLERMVNGYGNATTHHCDHRDAIIEIIMETTKNRMGLLYADPTGEPEQEFDTISCLTTDLRYKRFDILIHFSANSIKRAGKTHLFNYLNRIDKRYGFLRLPQGKNQWTFLFATNWRQVPLPNDQFVLLGTSESHEVLNHLGNTKDSNLLSGQQLHLPIQGV